ncbi:winged helix DNA-binding domain-containing protein [Kitasatospora sp. NA04385]|uniref:DNA glycosylase AlkZ-like family protein n=1 Tax=Kitasatospora sp. NA04385 TaxID=2742135 RepID=UPI001591200C|nr:crosslink repair DNA glycosylase YcaQ family protein [Kitasatospora sp. NA04385]QKW20932.1 winged helix DNA-binding domain-containing protein [Kitasatospora sp. NA04385]
MANGEVPAAKLRAWWAHRQWLDGGRHRGASAAQVLAATGWARTGGGSAPYLGLFARAGLRRAEVDAALAALEVQELPAARGRSYLLPAEDFALGLAAGAGATETELGAAVRQLGVTRDEIEQLCLTLAQLLSPTVPLTSAELYVQAGPAVRPLGDAGRRRGVASTLPLALGLLRSRGLARRVPVDGRLDHQRHGYLGWDRPVHGEAADLARRYFAWAAPASVRQFRRFSGFGAATAKAALAPLELVALPGTELLLPSELAGEFAEFTVPSEPAYALLAATDGLHLLRRDLSRLVDPRDADRPVPASRTGRVLGAEADPPTHLVVDRGRIVGFWEYDPERRELVHELFVPMDAALRAALEAAESFVREDLGDARAAGPDSPRSRAPKLAALRAAPRKE